MHVSQNQNIADNKITHKQKHLWYVHMYIDLVDITRIYGSFQLLLGMWVSANFNDPSL